MEMSALRSIGGEAFRQSSRQAHHGRRAVGRIKENIDHIGLAGIRQGFGEGLNEFAVCGHPRALSAADQLQIRS